uniref:Uncharacterized protein MANES_13G016800 n=1 Tax=Rhizophora mucronata TaxID=61149 RepID=A0A2P2L5K1_RHIMU
MSNDHDHWIVFYCSHYLLFELSDWKIIIRHCRAAFPVTEHKAERRSPMTPSEANHPLGTT